VPPAPIRGEIVVLRDWRDEDAEPLVAPFEEDPDLAWMVGIDDEPSAANLRKWWAGEAERRENEEFAGLVVADAETEAPLGVVNFGNVRRRLGRTDLGIWLVSGARGRGAAAEAMQLICAWGFRDAGFHRIQLITLAINAPMRRLAERAGFREEALLREYTFERGAGHDHVLYGMLRGEFA
jgi:ribosomal-protein-alanine N-acetyltransferase